MTITNRFIAKLTVLSVLIVCSFNIYSLVSQYESYLGKSQSLLTKDDNIVITSSQVYRNDVKSKTISTSLSMDIVQNAYNATFATLVDLCPRSKNESIMNCLDKTYQAITYRNHQKRNDTDPTPTSSSSVKIQPKNDGQRWWFQSMLRDAGALENIVPTGIQGSWHIGQATNPNVSMCIIEKIGTKQWQRLFSSLNDKREQFRSDTNRVISIPVLEGDEEDPYPSFVFFRDPLDRFLSAYIDKCVTKFRRTKENHCEPNEINNIKENENHMLAGFTYDDDYDQNRDDDYNTKRKGINKKTMFSLYVDTMPLKWNLHFFPQSFYCNGIYRFIDKYDFVGHMDSKFYESLAALGKRHGGRFEKELNRVFNYTMLHSSDNVGVETKASDKVKEYYTPRTLRKVLEYVSIDYVLLNMTIPDWAEEMLREDNENTS